MLKLTATQRAGSPRRTATAWGLLGSTEAAACSEVDATVLTALIHTQHDRKAAHEAAGRTTEPGA